MQDNLTTAKLFFEACEKGLGWEACKQYCREDGTFSCQNEALKGMKALKDYPEFMVAIHKMMPDAGYQILCFAEDRERSTVSASAIFKGTHSGCENPDGLAATGKSTASDYVYVMVFEGGKIRHMTKIWNHVWAFSQLGWC